jgi:hypothetical protein
LFADDTGIQALARPLAFGFAVDSVGGYDFNYVGRFVGVPVGNAKISKPL